MLCAVWLLPGLVGHAPWKGGDGEHFVALWLWQQSGMPLQAAPLYSWVASATAWLTSPVLPLADGARLASGTLFAIGSSSKAFTATSLAMLVDEGKVRWDDKATLHLPGFQLHDSYATRDLTIRDLLSHRSGLSRGDLMWYGSSYSRDEILRRVRFLEPSWGFRERFGYQNLMYLAAVQVAAKASGMSWDDFVRTRIFQPLGMTSSSTSITALSGAANLATPHAEFDDTVRTVPYRNIDNQFTLPSCVTAEGVTSNDVAPGIQVE